MNNLVNATTNNNVEKFLENIPMKKILEKCWWVPIVYVSIKSLTDSITSSEYHAHFKFDKNKGIFELDLAPSSQTVIQ